MRWEALLTRYARPLERVAIWVAAASALAAFAVEDPWGVLLCAAASAGALTAADALRKIRRLG